MVNEGLLRDKNQKKEKRDKEHQHYLKEGGPFKQEDGEDKDEVLEREKSVVRQRKEAIVRREGGEERESFLITSRGD